MNVQNANSSLSYDWKLSDFPKKRRYNVFSCFAGGGGSSMGYKLAKYNVIGCNEIDKKMNELYTKNLNPKYNYREDIRTFNKRDDMPKELYELDILDGSPPCSTFSIAGNREKDWGKNKQFQEGQAKQILSELVFDFIRTIHKLKPKIFVIENVKGMTIGNAKGYLIEINNKLKDKYNIQFFLLNSATMGIPQSRNRLFIIGYKKKLKYGKLNLRFNEKPILYKKIKEKKGIGYKKITQRDKTMWENKKYGDKEYSDIYERIYNKYSCWNSKIIYDNQVFPTMTSTDGGRYLLYSECRFVSKKELIKIMSYPKDYDFMNMNCRYVMGMSVPPLMMAKIAIEIKKQWLDK